MQKADDIKKNPQGVRQKSECRRQMTEGRRKTEGRGANTDSSRRRQKAECRRQKTNGRR